MECPSANASRLALLLVIAATGCRIGYDELAVAVRNDAGVAGGGYDAYAGSAGGGYGANAGGANAGGAGGQFASSGAAGSAGDTAGSVAGSAGGGVIFAGTTSSAGVSGASGTGTSGAAGAGGNAGPPDPTLCVSNSFGGHNYLLCRETRSWADAAAGCAAIGMCLVRIDDATENQWLFANANVEGGRTSEVWIGASDTAVEGEWRWTNGDLFWLGVNNGTPQNGLFAGWYSREPNDVGGNEHCGALETKSATPGWYDLQCSLLGPYICESL